MYRILKQVNNTENMWAFHTEDGVVWTAADVDTATAKIRTLVDTSPVTSIRLIELVAFDISVAVSATTEEPAP